MSARGRFKQVPFQSGKVSAVLSLPKSTPASAEWPKIVDLLNRDNPAVQTGSVRRPAVGVANGQPTMVFDGTDVIKWPLAANNNPTAHMELLFWIKPASNVSTRQRILNAGVTSSTNKLVIDYVIGVFQVNFYRTATAGRQLTTTLGPTASVWQSIRIKFKGAASAVDADAMRVYKNGVNLTGTFGDIGAGGAMTSLNAATGDMLIGASSDADTPATSLLDTTEIGPMVYVARQELTDREAADLLDFNRPKA